MTRTLKIPEDLGKKIKILTIILKIFKDFPKILMKILKRILKGPQEDLVRSLKILERSSPGNDKSKLKQGWELTLVVK